MFRIHVIDWPQDWWAYSMFLIKCLWFHQCLLFHIITLNNGILFSCWLMGWPLILYNLLRSQVVPEKKKSPFHINALMNGNHNSSKSSLTDGWLTSHGRRKIHRKNDEQNRWFCYQFCVIKCSWWFNIWTMAWRGI